MLFLGVGEFSQKAQWRDTNVSYILPQLICKSCNHCRDVDLGRDPHRSENSWLCPLCSSPYNNSEIENLLLETISRKFLAYNLQDLLCKKCSEIKLENLIKICKCAGEYQEVSPKGDLIKLLNTFHSLSTTFQMPALCETTKHILDLV